MAQEPVLRQSPKKTTRKRSPQSQPLSLRGRALRLLGRRELSRQELEGKLRRYVGVAADVDTGADVDFDATFGAEKPPPPPTAADLEALLDDLTERGWLSDARYAEALVRKRTGNFARRSIAQELKRAGVDEDVTAAALTQNPESDPDEEFAAALALCQRKFRRVPADQKEKARQIRFLQSRGYSIGLALRVIKQLGAAGNESDE